ncbi:hypothetical protein MASR2M29_07860 [Spirochaetota bacterium]
MKPFDIGCCARIAMEGVLAKTYGFTEQGWLDNLKAALGKDGNIIFVAELDGELAGFAWVHPRGAFLAAPYLRFIAVSQKHKGRGIGKLLVNEFERQTAHTKRDYMLLVSDFNLDAQGLYAKLGYKKVGELADFVIEGVSEHIMVKKHTGRNE